MKFYTSDTHFYHTNIIKYESRPFANSEEMNDYLIYKWNEKVKKGDEVYILGDFAFCTGKQANELLQKLNGQKYLVQGNHDSFLKDKEFDRKQFVWIKDYAKINDDGKKIIMFHYPIQVWDCRHHDSIHLYGHIHSNLGNHSMEYDIPNSYNVGVDVNGFEPKTLKELIGGK